MSEDNLLSRQRHRGGAEKTAPVVQYTAKDFQLEVLDKLAEMQGLAESLEESWNKKLEAVREQRLLKFDSRTLIAHGSDCAFNYWLCDSGCAQRRKTRQRD